MNDQITDITGFKASDFIGSKVRSYLSIIHPDDQDYVATEIAQQFKKNQKYSIDYRIIASNGSIKWVSEQGDAVRDENGLPIEIDGFIFDITNKKNHEQNEKDFLARLELSEDIAGIGYWEFDPNTQELFWSKNVYEIHGVDKDSYIPTIDTALSFYHPDDVDMVKSELEKSSKDKISFSLRARIIRGDGGIRNIQSRGRPTYNENLEIQKIVGVFQDITETILQEKKLDEALSFQKLVMENIPDYIFVKDKDYKIVNANSAFLSLYPEERRNQIIGRTTFDDYSEADKNVFLEHDKIAFSKGYSENEETILFPSGKKITLKTIKKRFYTADGQAFILVVSHDITARKEFEAEVINHKENLENIIQSRTQELQKALDDSKSAERAKSDFFANMSHELRTPLNSIIGMAQLIEGTDLNDEQTEMFGYMKTSSSILLKTVNDILDVSKIEAKELFLEKIPFDVFENLRGTVETLRAITSKKYITLTHNLSNLSQVVIGDPTRFTRIATNLIANAIRYTDEGYIEVQAHLTLSQDSSNHGNFTLTVKDTGIGIEASKIDVIFEKFTQADTSITRRFGGTGLGLAITKELVEMMGGRITVTSEIDKGSLFTVSIPFELASLDDLVDEEDGVFSEDDYQSAFNRISIKSARFLVAEDHDMNQLFMRKLLDNLGARNYKIVENGELAVSEVQNNNYDILLMDCHMPILSGYDATVKIRFLNDSFAASIPIIAMTANAMPEDKAICLQTGMNAYISKPIDIGNFKNILSEWINFENTDDTNREESEMMPVNLDNLISNSQGDDEFVREMLVLFTEQATEQITSLEKHCVDGESKEWVEVSHALKGTAGSVGAEAMRLVCATAQKMPVAEASERRQIVDSIKTEYQKAVDYLKEIKMIAG